MKRILLTLLVIALGACSPQKRLVRLLERYPQPVEVDTVYKDTVIYRDTLIEVPIPGDTVHDSILVPLPYEMPLKRLKKRCGLAEAEAVVKDSHLYLTVWQHDSLLQLKLDSAIRESSDTILIHEQEVVTKTEYVEKKFFKHGFWILVAFVAFIIGLLILRIK